MSKLLDHATALYDALNVAATTETVNGREARVFRGSITRVYRSLEIPHSRYSEVRRGLIESGSITIVRQGSRRADSIIVLHKIPDEESLVTVENLGLTSDAEAAIVYQQLQDLRHRIGSLSVPDALLNIEQRMQEFDNRITKVEQQLNQKGR